MENDSSRTSDRSKSGVAFEPRDGKVIEYRKLGVWDLYIERDKLLSYFPTSWKIDVYAGMWNDIPYLWGTICDTGMCTIMATVVTQPNPHFGKIPASIFEFMVRVLHYFADNTLS
jgi:hypothetical protein